MHRTCVQVEVSFGWNHQVTWSLSGKHVLKVHMYELCDFLHIIGRTLYFLTLLDLILGHGFCDMVKSSGACEGKMWRCWLGKERGCDWEKPANHHKHRADHTRCVVCHLDAAPTPTKVEAGYESRFHAHSYLVSFL